MRIMTALVLGALTLTGTGCNGGGNGYSNPGQCNPPNGITTTLVYPAPNSTGIPDNFGVVVFGSTAALPASYSAYVVNDTTLNAVYFNTPLGTPPVPLPAPKAVPGFPNPVYQSSGNPGTSFVSGSAITVYLNDTGSNCSPTFNLGTFRVL
jgi:hypothetical protein